MREFFTTRDAVATADWVGRARIAPPEFEFPQASAKDQRPTTPLCPIPTEIRLSISSHPPFLHVAAADRLPTIGPGWRKTSAAVGG